MREDSGMCTIFSTSSKIPDIFRAVGFRICFEFCPYSSYFSSSSGICGIFRALRVKTFALSYMYARVKQ